MLQDLPPYLTTRELADLIRVKERKVYDLAAAGEVPHSRATGKLLFPRDAVLAWIDRAGDAADEGQERPAVVLGSHDLLLEWALRESGCGLASLFDGSLDGIERLARREGVAAGVHVPDNEDDDWNIEAVASQFAFKSVVLIEWAKRNRGFIVPAGNPARISSVADLAGKRLAQRQQAAGTYVLLQKLVAEAGNNLEAAIIDGPLVRDEREAAQAVFGGEADVAFGLESAAHQSRLDFVPVCTERFDLVVLRREYFEPAFQKLLSFARSEAFVNKAAQLGGYDISDLGKVHFNGY
ncbi:helix-turn-helix transcriptional regulator [uncultured Roseibium sp.]|uniref:helix-turn-helix transcriptional regulator n=1 Tax=uncultured Roseibium sp. TaxID=1936171 RepID=UPI003217C819